MVNIRCLIPSSFKSWLSLESLVISIATALGLVNKVILRKNVQTFFCIRTFPFQQIISILEDNVSGWKQKCLQGGLIGISQQRVSLQIKTQNMQSSTFWKYARMCYKTSRQGAGGPRLFAKKKALWRMMANEQITITSTIN